MNLEVELRPRVGSRRDPELGEQKVHHAGFSIVVSTDAMKNSPGRDAIEVGLVNKSPGSPINFLPPVRRFEPEAREAIAKAVKEELQRLAEEEGGKLAEQEANAPRKTFQPPSDEQMMAPPPSSLQDAVNQELTQEDGDDVDAIV